MSVASRGLVSSTHLGGPAAVRCNKFRPSIDCGTTGEARRKNVGLESIDNQSRLERLRDRWFVHVEGLAGIELNAQADSRCPVSMLLTDILEAFQEVSQIGIVREGNGFERMARRKRDGHGWSRYLELVEVGGSPIRVHRKRKSNVGEDFAIIGVGDRFGERFRDVVLGSVIYSRRYLKIQSTPYSL